MNVSWHGTHLPLLETGRAHLLLQSAMLAAFVHPDVPGLH